MIAYPRQLLETHVLEPQDDEARGELRASFLDTDTMELGTEAQQLDVLEVGSEPLQALDEVGGTMGIRHTISVAIVVQHADRLEARRLRDGIVLELTLRATSRDTRAAMLNTPDPDEAHPQTFDDLSWRVDYRPLFPATQNETATLVFTLDTTVDR